MVSPLPSRWTESDEEERGDVRRVEEEQLFEAPEAATQQRLSVS